jgi:uncharacterized protein YqiB (DUF1249 family)
MKITKKLLYTPKLVKYTGQPWQEMKAVYDENWKRLTACDNAAQKKQQLVGRYITEGYADGHAVYQIIEETKSNVVVQVVRGIGDDWVIPYWGEVGVINKKYAESKVNGRDALAKIFRK